MKVCICGGTNPATNTKWLGVGARLGELLVKHDFEMVWGGNAFGVLANIHKQYADKQKANTLILPKAYEEDLKKMNVDKVIAAETVSDRTRKMYSMVNAIIFIPGGIGTIYEFWAAVEYKRAGEYDIDIIMLNHDGFFDHQLSHFKFINEHGFTKIGKGGAPYKTKAEDLFKVVNTPEELIKELQKIRKRRGT